MGGYLHRLDTGFRRYDGPVAKTRTAIPSSATFSA